MYELQGNSELEDLGVIRGALMTSQILGLSYNITCSMIRTGQIPGTMFGKDLRTFTTTRRALKKYFDNLAYAKGEAAARKLVDKENKS